MGDGRDESQPEAVRSQISDGAVVFGPVVQAGTFTGQIHHHGDERQPLDLLALRLRGRIPSNLSKCSSGAQLHPEMRILPWKLR